MKAGDKLWLVMAGYDAMGGCDVYLRHVTVIDVDGFGDRIVEFENGRKMDVPHDDPDCFVDKMAACGRWRFGFRSSGPRGNGRSSGVERMPDADDMKLHEAAKSAFWNWYLQEFNRDADLTVERDLRLFKAFKAGFCLGWGRCSDESWWADW